MYVSNKNDTHMYIHVRVYTYMCFALFVCLTLLASFFLPSHLSFKTCTYGDYYRYSVYCTCIHTGKAKVGIYS